jgi:hypothetical protein
MASAAGQKTLFGRRFKDIGIQGVTLFANRNSFFVVLVVALSTISCQSRMHCMIEGNWVVLLLDMIDDNCARYFHSFNRYKHRL